MYIDNINKKHNDYRYYLRTTTKIQILAEISPFSADGDCGDLEVLFVSPLVHSRGICYASRCAVEQLHPEVTVRETVTPNFERQNVHFYVNRCGFHIAKSYNSLRPDPNDPGAAEHIGGMLPNGLFRF